MSITAIVENDAVKLPMHVPDGTQVEISLPSPIPEGGAKTVPPEVVRESRSFYEEHKEFAGCIKGGLPDLATEHDHYAHGTMRAEMVQEALQTASSEGGPTLYDQLKEFVGCIKGGPSDMAAEHDHYAHGTPKRGGQ